MSEYVRSSSAIAIPLAPFRGDTKTASIEAILKHTLKGYPLIPELLKANTYSDVATLTDQFYKYGKEKHPLRLPTIYLDTEFSPKGITANANTTIGYTTYPIAQIRQNKVNTVDTSKKGTTTELLDTLKLPLEGVTKAITDNPDIDSIDDAFIGLTLNMASEEQLDLQYLHRFFEVMEPKVTDMNHDIASLADTHIFYDTEGIEHITPKTSPEIEGEVEGLFTSVSLTFDLDTVTSTNPSLRYRVSLGNGYTGFRPYNIVDKDLNYGTTTVLVWEFTEDIVIEQRESKKDRTNIYLNFLEGEYKAAISVTQIQRLTQVGSIGSVGTCKSEFVKTGEVIDFTTGNIGFSGILGYMDITRQTGVDELTVMRVYNPAHHSYITSNTAVTVIALEDLVRFRKLDAQYLLDSTPEEQQEDTSGFYVILFKELVDELSPTDKGLLCNTALTLVLNAYQEVKLKWYQTTVFKAILTIVILILTIVAIYYGAYDVAAYLISAEATLLGSIVAIVIAIAPYVLVSLLADEFADYAAAHPEEVVAIIAVTAIISIVSKNYEFFGSVVTQQLAALTSAVMLQAHAIGVDNKLARLEQDNSEYLDEYSQKLEELDELEEASFGTITKADLSFLLESDQLVDAGRAPMFILETPDSFYHRTVHLGNPTQLEYSQVNNYYSQALKLPSIGTGHTLIF